MIRPLVAIAAASCALAGTAMAQCADPLSGDLAPPREPQAFTQERHLKGVSRPILSRGVASIEDEAVIWRVTTPIEIVTRIDDDGVTQAIDGGPFEPVAQAAGGDLSTQLGFAALLRVDVEALRLSYEVEAAPNEPGSPWALKLTPRDTQLSQQIAAIRVEGCSVVDGVMVEQTNGDQLVVRFSGPAE